MVKKLLSIVLVVVTMVACSVAGQSSDPRPAMQRSYDLRTLNFVATEGLVVSEENSFYPQADVVWRGDAPGPRIAQIGAMFQVAADRNQNVLTGTQPVDVDIQLVRFHGVTEKTRATVGGVYNIIFLMTVRDATTGTVIEPTRRIVADLGAPGGSGATVLEARGRTEKVEVTDFLTATLRSQLF